MRLLWILVLLVANALNAQSPDEIRAAMERAERYYLLEERQTTSNLKWLPNSAKIGVGFDTAAGSSICYWGPCQMEGFRRPIFKLSFTQQPDGSCTDSLIPEGVSLDCLSSAQMSAKTEVISTLQQLSESIKGGIQYSSSAVDYEASLRYSYSREIRSVIDTMFGMKATLYLTRGIVTWARLTAFTPHLNLSEQFRFAINTMPCCNQSASLQDYVKKYIIGYYGLTYIDDLLLGGSIQQSVVISEENRKELQKNGFNGNQEVEAKYAEAIFATTLRTQLSNESNTPDLNTFRKFAQVGSMATFGGATSYSSVQEWVGTIQTNPSIIQFRVSSILDLLDAEHFPNDPQIVDKRELIREVQQKYMDTPLFCYKNCSENGYCFPSGHFGIGECKCKNGLRPPDCSAYTYLPTGVLTRVLKNNQCLSNFELGEYHLGFFNEIKAWQTCFSNLDDLVKGPAGTLCGLVYFSLTIPCNRHDPHSRRCPDFYSSYTWTKSGYYPVTLWSCVKNSNRSDDLPGTLCGFHSTMDYDIQSPALCGDYDVSTGKCPKGFTNRYIWMSDQKTGGWIRTCSKD